jgi:sulfur transfer complex TusBCD TusB component (DsrH family)
VQFFDDNAAEIEAAMGNHHSKEGFQLVQNGISSALVQNWQCHTMGNHHSKEGFQLVQNGISSALVRNWQCHTRG